MVSSSGVFLLIVDLYGRNKYLGTVQRIVKEIRDLSEKLQSQPFWLKKRLSPLLMKVDMLQLHSRIA